MSLRWEFVFSRARAGLFAFCVLVSSLGEAGPLVRKIILQGDFSVPAEQVLEVLPFHEGDPFDPKQLDQGLDYLRHWGVFDVLEVRLDITSHGVDLYLQLHQAVIVTGIHVSGNYPYVESKILKRLNLYVGDIYTPIRAEEQVKRIKEFYQREGYYNTSVVIQEESSAEKNGVRLIFKIDRGFRLRIGDISVDGNHVFSKERFISKLNPLAFFSERKLKEHVRGIVDFYRKKGYLKADIRVVKKEFDFEKKKVHLQLLVEEGPRVMVRFLGDAYFHKRSLRRTMTLFKEGSFDEVDLEESAKALEKKYRSAGFRTVQVTPEKELVKEDLWRVTFQIHPGRRIFLQQFRFIGNHSISGRKLRKQMSIKKHSFSNNGVWNQKKLKKDFLLLEKYYQSNGFLNAKIVDWKLSKTPSRFRDIIDITIDEGVQTKIGSIEFSGDPIFNKKSLLKELNLKMEKPLDVTLLEKERETLLIYYTDHGYPYTEVRQDVEINEDRRISIIRYEVQPGTKVQIGEILKVGDVLTSARAIDHAMSLHKGEPFSYNKLIDSRLSLRRMGAFSMVDIEPIGLQEKEQVVHLRTKVEERNPFVLDLDGQYSTDANFSGAVRFTNYNSFGWAKQTHLLLRAGLEEARGELGWLDPRFVGTPWQLSISGWSNYDKEPIQTSLQHGGGFSVFRQFSRIGFLNRYELARTHILSGSTNDPSALRDNTLSKVITSGSYDNRDHYGDPSRGIFTLLTAEMINEIKGLEANFFKIRSGFSHFYSPLRRITLAQTARFDHIQGFTTTTNIPESERLTLGGDDTIRGFEEDRLGPLNTAGQAVGGRTRWVYNGEIHFRVVRNFQGAVFFDAGDLGANARALEWDTIRESAGFGIHYVTPVGPIRADYGIILDRRAGEHFGRFHLTFGSAF